ncbi:MAG: helix-turn-helix domain-containing protein [Betaproteobacteria bacterium]|nr:helix-turn-helix domain-containing protein [Betaproteobacteria bacterium]
MGNRSRRAVGSPGYCHGHGVLADCIVWPYQAGRNYIMARDLSARHYQTVERAIGFIRNNLRQQPTLEEIAQAVHMSPFHLQRVFSEWAGLSPKRFLQYVTKEHAKASLLRSRTVLEVADDLGMSSSSRLHDLMVTSEAMTPGEVQSLGNGLHVGFGMGDSPFGAVCLAWTPRGICHFAFLDQSSQDHEASLLLAWPRARFERDDKKAREWLDEIFPATPGRGCIHLVLRGTNFQIKVWEAMIHTRPGQVLSYGQVAERIGHPRAHRAVGSVASARDSPALPS